MAKLEKKHADQLERIKKNVEGALETQHKNSQFYWNSKEFIYKSSMGDDEKNSAIDLGRTTLESNELEPYIARQVGEIYRQLPDPSVSPKFDGNPALIAKAEIIEGTTRAIFQNAINIKVKSFKNALAGGFYVFEMATQNVRNDSFDQEIVIKMVDDVTQCFFDPLAKESHKGDGEFCGKMIPKLKEDFKKEYRDVDIDSINFYGGEKTWFDYREVGSRKQEIIKICCYWEKKYETKKLVLLSSPLSPNYQQSMWKEDYEKEVNKIENVGKIFPKIIKEENREVVVGTHYYEIMGSKVLKHEQLETKDLPLIKCAGNPEDLKDGEMDRSLIYQAMDIQRAKNMAFQSITTQIEDQGRTDEYIPQAGLPDGGDALLAWTEPQKKHIAKIYKHIDKNGLPIPKPDRIPPSPIDGSIMQFYEMTSAAIQRALGSFDSQQGIQKQDMSGLAIRNGAIQANNAVMPFVINYIEAWTQAAKICVAWIPIYYTNLRRILTVDKNGDDSYQMINDPMSNPHSKMDYDADDMNVLVKMDLSFEMQKQVALENIQLATNFSPEAKQFFGTDGFHFVLDNMTFRDVSKVKQEFNEFMKKKAAGAAKAQEMALKTNPVIAQTQIQEMKMQDNEQDRKLELIQIVSDSKLKERELELEEAKVEAQILESRDKLLAESLKVQAENTRSQVDAAIAMDRHAYDKIESERAHALKVRDSNRSHVLDLAKTILENKNVDSEKRKADEEESRQDDEKGMLNE